MRDSVFSRTAARIGLLPKLRLGGMRAQLFLPEWVYDLCVLFFFPINWAIAAAASRYPDAYAAKDWPLDPDLKPGCLKSPGPEVREEIRQRGDARLSDEELWSLFDSLPAPKTNDMIGNWRGKVVRTGSWLDVAAAAERVLRRFGIEWGKRFLTPYRGDPFILILWGRAIFPVPIWGNVSMPETGLRGKVGATMTYDHQPWKDHFRVLDDGSASGRRMMLGNWISREKNGGWFTLEELPEMDEAVPDLLVKSPY